MLPIPAKCCGCSACYAVCPKRAITMKPDVEGFLQPVIDETLCVHCGLCEKVCPVLHPGQKRMPLAVYAVKAKDDELRMKSSSGGMFTLLAREILRQGGIVYGAGWEKPAWRVIHKSAENEEELDELRGSKYVQSDMGNTYRQVKAQLDSGRKVLFSGCPCQIAGLKLFLQKPYDNLLCVDLICHSVASPKVFELYKQSITSKGKLVYFHFRDKKEGWAPFYIRYELDNGSRVSTKFIDTFLGKGWALGWFCRQSCFACPKGFSSRSDLTIADAWGCAEFAKDFADGMGVSLCFIVTAKGKECWKKVENRGECSYVPVDIQVATQDNPCAWSPVTKKDAWNFPDWKRRRFFRQLTGAWSVDSKCIHQLFKRTLFKKLITRAYHAFTLLRGH
jgi:coenzyme F420-reducing hydrogenase beta subunit